MGDFKKSANKFTGKMMDVSYNHSKIENKISQKVFFVLSIITGIIGLIVLIFSWKAGLIVLGIGALFYGISRLAKFGNKMNEKYYKRSKESLKNQ